MLTNSSHNVLRVFIFIALILIYVVSSFAETIIYRYDNAKRLERVEYEDGAVIEYYYDEVGNREQKVISKTLVDSDQDGVTDDEDNCPDTNNTDQSDVDNDDVGDACDNCREVSNLNQRDSNSEEDDNLSMDGEQHYGNICDPDFNNNGIVGFDDFNEFRRHFRQTVPPGPEDIDMNGNGIIGLDDFSIYRRYFRKAPGPGIGD